MLDFWEFVMSSHNLLGFSFLERLQKRKLQRQLRDLAEHTTKSIQADLLCLDPAIQQTIIQQTGLVLPRQQQESYLDECAPISALWAADLLVIKYLPYSDLIARLWLIRDKYYSLVHEDVYKTYLASLPDELSDLNLKTRFLNIASDSASSDPQDLQDFEAAIRSDATNLARQIQRLNYYKVLRLNSIYATKKSTLNITFAVLLLTATLSYMLFGNTQFETIQSMKDYAIPIATVFAGMIGSCMSLLQRTERASSAPSQFNDSVLDAMDIELSMSRRYIASLVLSGGIFACLIYLLAVSGIVKDIIPFLPKFSQSDQITVELSAHALSAVFGLQQKVSISQYALMMIWGFMAGFAERLVPDTLDSIMNKAKIKKD